jgi:hypothetical protein
VTERESVQWRPHPAFSGAHLPLPGIAYPGFAPVVAAFQCAPLPVALMAWVSRFTPWAPDFGAGSDDDETFDLAAG